MGLVLKNLRTGFFIRDSESDSYKLVSEFEDGSVEIVTNGSFLSRDEINKLADYSAKIGSKHYLRESPMIRYLINKSGNGLENFPRFNFDSTYDALMIGKKRIEAYQVGGERMNMQYRFNIIE